FFEELVRLGADLYIEDKLHDTVLDKAIKFDNLPAIKVLLDKGVELDHQEGILYTPWARARYKPAAADLLLNTKGAIRLTLNAEEKKLVDELLYSEISDVMEQIHRLDSPELIHAYVCSFNWDDDIDPMFALLESPQCSIVTAKEMYDLADGDYWLREQELKYEDERKYVSLINNIINRFPQLAPE
ncbi:MAG: DUF4274 domain-containing protein, partial [Bacteroidota bacterium]|nr:DUF4274 domain-containing protein [Bacteroidota bacterium]